MFELICCYAHVVPTNCARLCCCSGGAVVLIVSVFIKLHRKGFNLNFEIRFRSRSDK